MKAETIKHKNVRGNELLYLKLTHEITKREVIINIGQKTFDLLNAMGNTIADPNKKDNKI